MKQISKLVLVVTALAALSVAQGAPKKTPAKAAPKASAKQASSAPAAKASPTSSAEAKQRTHSASIQATPVQDGFDTFVKPLFRTAKGQEKTVIEVERFPYQEAVYQSPKAAEYFAKDQYRFVTPEDALLSRLSAMANGDYDGWLKSWDADSQQRLKEMEARPEFSREKRLSQWAGIMSQTKPVLVRKVQTGQFVIVSYKLVNKTGQDAGMFEFPACFRQEAGLWVGTDALKEDPLFNLLPWVTGHMSDEKDFRPLSETVIQ